ncbi:MAG: polynucleotide kinase-phosphatase [Deltaproteobacteria bacterium]|jgi:polynucleotide kinase-phosphatase|nr:polynucleotide kinase-phosphatase [Deltaproteobacteria bacterium]
MRLELHDPSLVLLIGATGSGKSSLARRLFKPTETLGSDFFRGLVSDDENNQACTDAAFECLKTVARARLAAGRLTVIDATNVRREDRARLIALAREHDLFAEAVALHVKPQICQERNRLRPERAQMPAQIAARQCDLLRRGLKHLGREGFRIVHVLEGPEQAEAAELVRLKLRVDRSDDAGPFDVIGDVHGCFGELTELLEKLGWRVDRDQLSAEPPAGRRAIFLGDFVDRGPDTVKTLRLLMNLSRSGAALCLPGNHESRLLRRLAGRETKETHGLAETMAQLAGAPESFLLEVKQFLGGLVSHYVLDGGRLVTAHAGLPERYQGRSSRRVRDFCLHGDATGEIDEFGLPVRVDWAESYRGRALVLYGHYPHAEVRRLNNAVCLDTGCVFGGRLTAWRHPEGELASTPAARTWYEPVRPLPVETARGPDDPPGGLIRLASVAGGRLVETGLAGPVRVAEERAAAALEIMSSFAVRPNWLVYLPPTMSPSEVSRRPDYLEHPAESFDYFRKRGELAVICETKHMGSRAVVALCRDARTAAERFGVDDGTRGAIYTRTGRDFFGDPAVAAAILERLARALEASGFWARFEANWTVLDGELLPWSAKARSLVGDHYAPVGVAGQGGLKRAIEALSLALARPQPPEAQAELESLLAAQRRRLTQVEAYSAAWRRYCWPVEGLEGLVLAPFQIMAVEGRTLGALSRLEHLELLREHLAGEPLFRPTEHRVVDVQDEASRLAAEEFWLESTAAGGEGMVVKPLRGLGGPTEPGRRLPQPALKCRGREYLRIIYGPEYDDPGHMELLKRRQLGRKRALAMQEFALGLEALERFVAGASLDRVHECVFGVLALETEPVDPRL